MGDPTEKLQAPTRNRYAISTSPQGGGGDSGFTVLEVLIALTVLAMSMAVLLGIFAQGLDRAHVNSLKIEARDLARSVLAQAEETPPNTLADSNGQTNGLTWSVHVAPYGSSADRDAWQFAPVTLTSTVRWSDHGRAQSVSLSTLRLLPKEVDQP